jgi:ankyrin repeat protein
VNRGHPAAFGTAIEAGKLSAAKKWLDEGLHPDFVADRIGTGLMIAAWEGNIEMMELFFSRGATVNATNANGEQALMHAAWRGRLEAVRWLLDRGAQINRPGLQWSALHYAVFNGHDQVARLLIARGADINARSTNGSTPLMMAAREGRDDLARLLLERGADTTVENDWGEDAFVWAMRNGHPDIAKTVATPQRFAAAASNPEAFGPVVRSNPIPQRIDDLIKEMQAASAERRLTPELQAAYLHAVRALRQASGRPAGVKDAPAALEIRARRADPRQEQAVLIYEGRAAVDAYFGEHPRLGGAAAEPGAEPLPRP